MNPDHPGDTISGSSLGMKKLHARPDTLDVLLFFAQLITLKK
jgi:hypothetical protein